MYFNQATNPTKLKHAVYLLSSTILGLLLSFIAHAVIEIGYLSWAQSRGIIITFYNGCALLPIIQIGLLLFGVIGGFFLGRFWWRMIYIEKVWAKKNKKSQI